MDPAPLFGSFARLLIYPSAQCLAEAGSAADLVRQVDPAASELLTRFARKLEAMGLAGWQELYVRTFDLNPICALEVGWQLYGDNYDRGEFLVKMRGELRSHGLAESVELPDHLSHILPLLGRMEDDQARGFAGEKVLPALRKMLSGLEGRESPYEDVLRAITRTLEVQYEDVSSEVPRD